MPLAEAKSPFALADANEQTRIGQGRMSGALDACEEFLSEVFVSLAPPLSAARALLMCSSLTSPFLCGLVCII